MSDLDRMRRCFQPRQWFFCEGEPDPDAVSEGDAFMWVYREDKNNGDYQVGYFSPGGDWMVESSWDTRDKAAARVRWLNGGRD